MSQLAIGVENGSRTQRFLVCKDCLNGIALASTPYLTDETKKELLLLLDSKLANLDAETIVLENMELKSSIDSRDATINMMNDELQPLRDRLKEAEDSLAEAEETMKELATAKRQAEKALRDERKKVS
jgi:septal ring factor EnvC (AmiA/AmiB activator)